MSTRYTLVCLPPLDDPKEWAAAIDEAIEPYSDDIYSWTAFERYDTHFAIREGTKLLTGDAIQSRRAYGTLRCSGGRSDILDFDAGRWRLRTWPRPSPSATSVRYILRPPTCRR